MMMLNHFTVGTNLGFQNKWKIVVKLLICDVQSNYVSSDVIISKALCYSLIGKEGIYTFLILCKT